SPGPAPRVRAIGSGGLDARDDGHDPEPRPERRGDRGSRALDGQRALRLRLLPAADPDVRGRRRRRRRAALRAGVDGAQAGTPQPLAEMESRLPQAFEQLLETMRRLEEHYRDVQDIEFTVEEGHLYLLQTRAAKRTAAAALKAAVEMVEDGLITREEAVARIDPGQLDQLLHPMLDPD